MPFWRLMERCGLRVRTVCRFLAHRVVAWSMIVCASSAFTPTRADSQSTRLLLSSASLIFPSPRLSNYQNIPAGATTPVTDSVSVVFTVDRIADTYWRYSAVKLRCALVTGGKPCSHVQWRYQGSSTWQDIASIDTDVDGRWTIPGLFNDPWSGTIWLRMKLSWTTDAPATYVATIAITMDVSRP